MQHSGPPGSTELAETEESALSLSLSAVALEGDRPRPGAKVLAVDRPKSTAILQVSEGLCLGREEKQGYDPS